jgi:hypothetical protein
MATDQDNTVVPTLFGDERLLEAEREIGDLYAMIGRRRQIAQAGGEPEPDDDFEAEYARIYRLEDYIAATPAIGLPGVMAKLRRLLDAEVGLPAGEADFDLLSLRQVHDVISSLTGEAGQSRGTPRPLYDGNGEAKMAGAS